MFSRYKKTFIASLLMLSSPLLLAQDVAEEDNGWSGKGELGLVRTTGNTDTESLLMGLEFIKEQDQWRHRAALTALNSKNSGNTTAERFGFDWQSNYKLDEKSWVLGSFRYESDKFSAFDNQQSLTIGYGRQLIDNAQTQLVGEIGIGYRDAELAATGVSESDAIVRGLLDFSRTITDNTVFTNRFLVESGSNNTFYQNLAGLSVSMNDAFAMKFGYEYRHNSDVPAGVDSTDTITSANLVYNFK